MFLQDGKGQLVFTQLPLINHIIDLMGHTPDMSHNLLS